MTGAEKLKKIMTGLEKQLKMDNVAAFIVLSVPGETESLLMLSPEYSCMKVSGTKIQVRANVDKHFKGDKVARDKSLEDTSDMLKRITEEGINCLYPFMEISEKLDKLIQDEKVKS